MRNKHPYYDSDRKKRNEGAALKCCFISFVGMILLFVFSAIVG
jgi:hypothetical protein